MCIQVNRWFYCPVQEPGHTVQQAQQAQQPPVQPQANPFSPWLQWQDQERAPHSEVSQLGLTEHNNYYYIRHKVESWIRCAAILATDCRDNPQAFHTEVYAHACPHCTQDDGCILSGAPVLNHMEDNPNLTQETDDRMVAAYASELTALLRSYLAQELEFMPPDEKSWVLHMRGQYCTEDRNHVVRDHPERGARSYDCHATCACTNKPWAHNISRAARKHEGFITRVKFSPEWFEFVLNDQGLQTWKDQAFADIPNQSWLNMINDASRRYDHLSAQIGNQLNQLIMLGPNVEPLAPGQPLRTPEEWHRTLSRREFVAYQLIYYPAMDPGITRRFLDRLMHDHILKALCPDVGPLLGLGNWRMLDYRFSASDEIRELVNLADGIAVDRYKTSAIRGSTRRRDNVVRILIRNRDIAFRNALIRQKLAEGAVLRFEIPAAVVVQAGEHTCNLCAEDFDVQNANVNIPVHLRLAQLPCCRNFVHFRCFKGAALQKKLACPFCNQSLVDMGLDPGMAGPEWVWNEQFADLPIASMVDEPSRHQRFRFEYPDLRMVSALNRLISREENPYDHMDEAEEEAEGEPA
ncbi:hypothetical protein FZEAL_4642 [Fusarium zealandicum]|uniref:Uncharacterized protein n=1 Tax=Fusarium zealandicum TaxID=1053134 RepID=A0A8H4XLN9_9HYPO|nr:hypothetical protein FZEAL_4642 [Fusarium zealandicum]